MTEIQNYIPSNDDMAETVEHQEFNENTPEADSLDLIETSQNVNIENTNTIENVIEEEKEVEEKEAGEKLFRFPLGTIKRIVKMGMFTLNSENRAKYFLYGSLAFLTFLNLCLYSVKLSRIIILYL